MAIADSTGLAVMATFKVVTGPKSHVTGARTTPTARTPVLASRFIPCGGKTALECSGSSPLAMACAGQARNHMNSPGSPHPQVVVDDGWPHTFHHTTKETTR